MSAHREAPGAMRGGSNDAPEPVATNAPDAVPGAVVVRQRREVLYFALRDKRILLGAAIVLFFVVYHLNPSYVMLLFTDPLGRKMIAVAAFLRASVTYRQDKARAAEPVAPEASVLTPSAV